MSAPRFINGATFSTDLLNELLDDTDADSYLSDLMALQTDPLIHDYFTSGSLSLGTTYQALDTTNLRVTIPANTNAKYLWTLVHFYGTIGLTYQAQVQLDVWDNTNSLKLNGWATSPTDAVNDVYGYSNNVSGTYWLPFNVYHFVPYDGTAQQVEVRGNRITATASLFNYGFDVKHIS